MISYLQRPFPFRTLCRFCGIMEIPVFNVRPHDQTHSTGVRQIVFQGIGGISVKEVEEYQTFEVTSLEDGFVGYFEIVK